MAALKEMANHKNPAAVQESAEPLETKAKEELSAAQEDLEKLEKGGGRQWIDKKLTSLKKLVQNTQAKLTLQSNEAAGALRKAGLRTKSRP
jgi:hypothetical protein